MTSPLLSHLNSAFFPTLLCVLNHFVLKKLLWNWPHRRKSIFMALVQTHYEKLAREPSLTNNSFTRRLPLPAVAFVC